MEEGEEGREGGRVGWRRSKEERRGKASREDPQNGASPMFLPPTHTCNRSKSKQCNNTPLHLSALQCSNSFRLLFAPHPRFPPHASSSSKIISLQKTEPPPPPPSLPLTPTPLPTPPPPPLPTHQSPALPLDKKSSPPPTPPAVPPSPSSPQYKPH